MSENTDLESFNLDNTVFGMPVYLSDDDQISMPLGAVVVLKYLDQEGNIGYISRSTDKVTVVEALGMASFAKGHLEILLHSRSED